MTMGFLTGGINLIVHRLAHCCTITPWLRHRSACSRPASACEVTEAMRDPTGTANLSLVITRDVTGHR